MFLPSLHSWWHLYAHFPEAPQQENEENRPKEPLFKSVAHYYLAMSGCPMQHVANALHWPANDVKAILAGLDQPENLERCIAFCQYLRIPPRLRDVALYKAGYCTPAHLSELDQEQAEALASRLEHLSLEEEAQLRAYFRAGSGSLE